nr:hypothetical transcript [Hymenolepis microstoma]
MKKGMFESKLISMGLSAPTKICLFKAKGVDLIGPSLAQKTPLTEKKSASVKERQNNGCKNLGSVTIQLGSCFLCASLEKVNFRRYSYSPLRVDTSIVDNRNDQKYPTSFEPQNHQTDYFAIKKYRIFSQATYTHTAKKSINRQLTSNYHDPTSTVLTSPYLLLYLCVCLFHICESFSCPSPPPPLVKSEAN